MGFSTSLGNTRPHKYGRIMWSPSKRQPEIPTPNIEFYDRETGTTTHSLQPGDYGNVQVWGKITNFYMKSYPSYTDRQYNTGKKTEHVANVTLDDGSELDTISFKIADESTNNVEYRSLALLNSLHTHLQMVKAGELEADAPVQIGLYKSVDKNNPAITYANSIIRLPSDYNEEGQPLFDDPQNFIRSTEESRPPRGEEQKNAKGEPLMANGRPVYDHSKAFDWAQNVINALREHYDGLRDKRTETETATQEPSEADDGDVDLVEVAQAVAGARPRAAA